MAPDSCVWGSDEVVMKHASRTMPATAGMHLRGMCRIGRKGRRRISSIGRAWSSETFVFQTSGLPRYPAGVPWRYLAVKGVLGGSGVPCDSWGGGDGIVSCVGGAGMLWSGVGEWLWARLARVVAACCR